MSIDSRLNKLTPALSARERAILVLGSLKDGRPDDPAWRNTMPPDQVAEFNRLIALMNVANRELSLHVGMLERTASELELREAWLVTEVLWQEHLDEIKWAMQSAIREPVTESEYRQMVEAWRAQWLPVRELAEIAADDYDGWTDADLEEVEGWDEPVVSDAALERVVAEKERELRRIVAEGRLPARGQGKKLNVQLGAFDDLVGRPSRVFPDDCDSYRVMPDDQATEAEQERGGLLRLQKVLNGGLAGMRDDLGLPAKLSELLRPTIARLLISCWVQVRTVEVILDEIAGEFGGADPLKPDLREELEETKQRLRTLQEHLGFLRMEVVLREPLDEEVEELRRWVRERASL